ncbi:MAG TPA: hypothetical protein VHZ97_07460 [Pseudonocardiaceae bacterium]|nr:hypothetical protein [Pseudonocardiaceae bacterium]
MTEPLDPDEFAELKKRVSRLRVDEAETRWLALRLDQDIQTVHGDLQSLRGDVGRVADSVGQVADALVAFGDRFDNLERRFDERFDNVDRRFDDVDRVLMEHGGKLTPLMRRSAR